MMRIFLKAAVLFLLCGHIQHTLAQQKYKAPPLSTESEKGIAPCPDTVFKFLFLKKIVEMNMILPAWLPVIGYDEISVLEGVVIPKPGSKHIDTHVSPSDFPFHHYTHDFSFNVKPDSTADNRFTNLLSNRVFKDEESGEIIDTVLMPYIHCEWETGLGAFNEGNPCSALNNAGTSAGFYTSGHERGDVIWNWPTLGDWVHVEGLWLWDRGHPPERTEIHPARLVAVRRNLPDKLVAGTGTAQVYATRTDIYASGDGGAFNNNRPESPDFVHKVRMSDKNYAFNVRHLLPKPSPNAVLKYAVKKQKGDNFPGNLDIIVHPDGTSDMNGPFVEVHIPWQGRADNYVLARTLHTYWDEDEGKPESFGIGAYEVDLHYIRFRKMKEAFGKSEFRVFLGVNGQYIFLNEFVDVPNILSEGLGKTKKRKWEINQQFTVYVPEGKSFRVHAGGWEADAIDGIMGTLMDQYAPCNSETKKWVNDRLNVASPLKSGGCLDDHIGEVHAMHEAEQIGSFREFIAFSDGRKEIDFCPCDNGKQKNVFKLAYSIKEIGSSTK